MADKKLSRREMLGRASLAAGGLVIGGAGGLLIGDQTAAGSSGGVGAGRSSAGPIKVAGVFPLTGVVAADGAEMRNGTVMAIDEINAAGGLLGRKLEYIEVDDQDSSSDQITSAFRRVVDQIKPHVAFSGYHLATGPQFDIVADAEQLYYELGTATAWVKLYKSNPKRYWCIFQGDPTEAWYGVGLARWMDEQVTNKTVPNTAKRAGILTADDAYDASIADHYKAEAEALGWTVARVERFTAGKVTDWGPLLSKFRDDDISFLFTATFSTPDNAAMIQEFAQSPLNAVLYQQYGPSVPEYLDLTGDVANGVVWSTVLGRIPDERGKAWIEAYETKFNTSPGWANAPGNYDLVMLWAAAVREVGDPSDFKAIAAATEKLTMRGVTGSHTMVDHAGVQYPYQNGDASLGQPQLIVQVQEGQQQVIFPSPYTTAEFQVPSWVR